MNSIKQPKPTSRLSSNIDGSNGVGSNRLLSPHLSVLEALQSTSHDQDQIQDQDQEQEDGPLESNESTPNLVNSYQFTSQASWHSIAGDYLTPRPTSSVLSSSDIDDIDEPTVEFPSSIRSQPGSSQSTATVQGNVDEDQDDDKTIEINLNSSQGDSKIDASKFVLPTMNEYNEDQKILIIGHKKLNFLQSLNDGELQEKFTMNHKSNYKIILIIFDGLIKIGNILNFLKINQSKLHDKLFIPIFKNLNIQIIIKLLKNYNINLLCSPINLNDHIGIGNLLNILKEDFLLQENSKPNLLPLSSHNLINDDENNLFAIEQSMSSYQLIRIASDSSVDYGNDLYDGQQSLSLRRHNSKSNKKIVLLKNKPYEIVHHVSKSPYLNNHKYKKLRKSNRSDTKYRKFVLLAISLSIGIGIGVTTALTITLFKHDSPNVPSSNQSDMKLSKLSQLAKNQLKIGYNNLLKKNLILFKQNVTSITKEIFHSSTKVLNKLSDYWTSFMVSSDQGVQTGLIWFI